MDTTSSCTPAADTHTNAIRANGGNGTRTIADLTAADLLAVVQNGVVAIAATYGVCEYRSGVTHV